MKTWHEGRPRGLMTDGKWRSFCLQTGELWCCFRSVGSMIHQSIRSETHRKTLSWQCLYPLIFWSSYTEFSFVIYKRLSGLCTQRCTLTCDLFNSQTAHTQINQCPPSEVLVTNHIPPAAEQPDLKLSRWTNQIRIIAEYDSPEWWSFYNPSFFAEQSSFLVVNQVHGFWQIMWICSDVMNTLSCTCGINIKR